MLREPLVGTARQAAIDWVIHHAGGEADFLGAYFIGSTAGQPDDASLAPGSDIDVVVVTAASSQPLKPGKVRHAGALLDVTIIPWRLLSSAEVVLTSYHLATGLRLGTIIADPTGRLRTLHSYVAAHFAEEAVVRRRCQDVREHIETGLGSIDRSAPWPDQVLTWLFATGQTAHIPLVAALRNPTVRLRYLAARDVLAQYGRLSLYPDLLDRLGAGELTAARVGQHVARLARTFDATAAIAKTRFFFSSDISPGARPVAIDGSWTLVRAGNHREAMFWIVATFARCSKILATDASPAEQGEHAEAFSDALRDLGIDSTEDLLRRADSVRQFLPALWACAEEMIAANPDVTRDAADEHAD